MKKQVEIITLTICLGMCLLSLATRVEASAPTGAPSSSFKEQPGPERDSQIEEVEILLKLGQVREAQGKLEQLLERFPSDPRVLESAAGFYLSQSNAAVAAPLLDKLEAVKGRNLSVVLLRAEQARLNHHYQKAREFYETALITDRGSPGIRRAYAEVLAELHEWAPARQLYRELFEEGVQEPGLRQDYRSLLEKSRPQINSTFDYRHAPQAQRIFVMEQKGAFWASPWLKLGAGVGEEIYKKKERDDVSAIDRFIMTQTFEAEWFLMRGLSILPYWQTAYYDGSQFHELRAALSFKCGPLTHLTGYDWNHVARDPMEALGVHGRIDRLHSRTSWLFFDRLEPGHEASVEWFSMRGSNNLVNGAADLGHKFTSDAFVDYKLFENPKTVLNYHFRNAHWDQKFEGADTAIAYLADEQSHSGGLYVEQPFGDYFNATAAVTRVSDLKRKTMALVWAFKVTVLAGEYGKLDLTYDYITGDSGTSGSGSSQSFTAGTTLYF